MKFGIRVTYKNLLRKDQFRENRHSEPHSILIGMSVILTIVSTCTVRFR